MVEYLKQNFLRPFQARWNAFLDHNPEKYLYVFPLALFLALLIIELCYPTTFLSTPMVDWKLPSEDAIPPTVPSGKKPISDTNLEWVFRYAPTGTEFKAGIPYWIFRAIPKIFPDEFANQGWEHFGFLKDNQDYYTSRQDLPSGMVLSDTIVEIPFAPVGVKLKRVSLNCCACHRGGVEDDQGNLTLYDGMPNHTADLQAFKRFMMNAVADDRFNAPNVIEKINESLQDDKKPPLTAKEELIYTAIVAIMRAPPNPPLPAGDWMSQRAPLNGPGRIDPFNSVKFEKIGVQDDHSDGTERFPSIWNQDLRYWHHYDGNTASLEARNFGSALGVGATSYSIHRETVREVGAWIESDLKAPTYPFPTNPTLAAHGKDVYMQNCASCHGIYDRGNRTLLLYDSNTKLTTPFSKSSFAASLKAITPPQHSGDSKPEGDSYMQRDTSIVATDPERLSTFDEASAKALSKYGADQALWPPEAFRWNELDASKKPAQGYLCGPLDGIWARAPYLHNGSVPTLDDLLKPDSQRPVSFYVGRTEYDQKKVGFQSEYDPEPQGAAEKKNKPGYDGDRQLFLYDTSQRGNSNLGHNYPATPLSGPDRAALLEYLKTL